jgi:sugar lactone lactonase YvrE
MKKAMTAIALLLALGVAYLLLWPTPISPVAIPVPSQPGFAGPFSVNSKLANLQVIDLHGEEGPETIGLGPDGKLYAAVASGNILRMNADGSGLEVFANTGGRVLGFDFDAGGNLIVADPYKGLLSIAPDRKVTLLTNAVNGDPIRYADAVVVAKNGKMYLSDASAHFSPREWGGTFEASVLDIMEQAATGRIVEYDPATKTTRLVAKGLSFANGVALSQDEQTLFVSETGRYRVWKISVGAKDVDLAQPNPLAGVLLDNLPGYPDNLTRGQGGKVWMGLVKPRNPAADNMADKPWLRSLTLRLPRAFWPIPRAYGHVVAFTEDGKIVADLQDPNGIYPETTGATETSDRLYIQSLHAKGLGWMPK